MSGEQRVQIAVDLTSFMRRMAVSRIRSEHPDWTERQVKREMLRVAFMPEPLPPASGDRPRQPSPARVLETRSSASPATSGLGEGPMSRIIVGVPGPWEVRGDLIAALARTHGTDYIFAGLLFMETGTKTMCEFDWCGPDDRMRGAFEVAGQGMLPDDVLDAVEAHRSTAYLIFGEPGYETARAAARFAVALLDAGGVAVKVDSAGVAHSRERWLQGAESAEPFDTYSLFVVLVGSEERYYSCGMHNFGLPDAAVSTSMENQEAAHLLNVFNMYQLVESPALNDGETFSMDAGSPRFRLKREPYVEGYDPGEPLYNPHGLWLLQPPGDPPAKKRWRWSFRG